MTRKTNWCAVVVCVAMSAMLAAPASAGDWSDDQKEVWSAIEGYWEVYAAGDVDGFLAAMHDDYTGWSYDQPLPSGKKTTEKWLKFGMPNRETLIYEITPTSIVVGDGFAVAHYYFEYVYKNAEGEMEDSSGRWTDVLVETGGEWMLIADHGGEVDDD
jgi:ketosteroid isomerase-like protein